jgi:hypothetical protein
LSIANQGFSPIIIGFIHFKICWKEYYWALLCSESSAALPTLDKLLLGFTLFSPTYLGYCIRLGKASQ